MPRNYWMMVISPDNFQVTRQQGFRIQGLRTTLKRRAEQMEVGDRLLFYLSSLRRFAATATLTSTYTENHSPLWRNHRGNEDYPYRVNIEKAAILEEGEFLDARQIGPRMDYVKKWTPEMWPLAFHGDLHLIPRRDFSMIEEEMKKLVAARAKR